jgi:Prokaryotic membrane lipoprotein lipid attachment site
MKNMLLALSAAFVLSGCPDAKVPKAPPKVPEPKAAAQTQHTLRVSQPSEMPDPGRPAGQSWIVERAAPRPVWPL